MLIATDEIKELVERARRKERVLLHDVSWDFYEAVLEEIGDRYIHVTYNEGNLEIMAPSREHEEGKTIISRLVETMATELRISLRMLGSTTWRRRDRDCGLEADECYYVQNYWRVPRRKEIDLKTDPPPDLAIEVEVSSKSLEKDSIYAKLKVPEIWRYKRGRLIFCRLNAGKYIQHSTSLAFPGLAPGDLERFVCLYEDVDDAEATQTFIRWVRKHLKKSARPYKS